MYDKSSIIEVLGCLIKKPDLILDENYKLEIDDFPEKFHKIVFGAINNLIMNGVKKIDAIIVDDFLNKYDKQYKIFSDNNGFEYIEKITEISSFENFDFNYKNLKKYSLLRKLKTDGFDISDFYNSDILDLSIQEEIQQRFNNSSIQEIMDYYDKKLIHIKEKYYKEEGQIGHQSGKGLRELKEELKEIPEMGVPVFGELYNTIIRGSRLKKLYLRSSDSGGGKTRAAIGDACMTAIGEFYDWENNKWINYNIKEPTLLIVTELEIEEIQTMILSCISGVNEEKILSGNYNSTEEEIIEKCITIIENSPMWIEQIPNFNIDDIERTVKKYKLEHNIGYVYFDYIFTSVKMLMEIASKTKGMKLREDNVLYIFAERMKFLCNTLNIHISTSTQLNGEWENSKTKNQNLLRGSKAIADKIDVGVIMLEPTQKDFECIEHILHNGFYKKPNRVYHIYKLRRGRLNKVMIWTYIDLGTCRSYDQFVTDKNYELIDIEKTSLIDIFKNTIVDEDEINNENNNDDLDY